MAKIRILSTIILDQVGSVRIQGPLEEWRKLHKEIGLLIESSDSQPDDSFYQEGAFGNTGLEPVASLDLYEDVKFSLSGTPLRRCTSQ